MKSGEKKSKFHKLDMFLSPNEIPNSPKRDLKSVQNAQESIYNNKKIEKINQADIEKREQLIKNRETEIMYIKNKLKDEIDTERSKLSVEEIKNFMNEYKKYIIEYKEWREVQDKLSNLKHGSEEALYLENAKKLSEIQIKKEKISLLSKLIKEKYNLLLEPDLWIDIIKLYKEFGLDDVYQMLCAKREQEIDKLLSIRQKEIIKKYKIELEKYKMNKSNEFKTTIPKWQM